MSDLAPTLSCQVCYTAANCLSWRCQQCGGTLGIDTMPSFDPSLIDQTTWSLWRYKFTSRLKHYLIRRRLYSTDQGQGWSA